MVLIKPVLHRQFRPTGLEDGSPSPLLGCDGILVGRRFKQGDAKIRKYKIRFGDIWLESLKRKTTGSKWCHLCQKLMIPNLDLIPNLFAVSASPRNVILTNQSEIFWSTISKVICYMGPFHPLKKEEAICMMKTFPFLFSPQKVMSPGPNIIPSFLLLIVPSPYPLHIKTFHLYNPLEHLSSCEVGCCLIY